MKKSEKRRREIRFYSKKNEQIVVVHTEREKKYAEILEKKGDVQSYEANAMLDMSKYIHVQRLSIRNSYFAVQWSSDFLLHYTDGRIGIRELLSLDDLMKPSIQQQLEFSRRYWLQQAFDWKIVIMGE